MVKSKVVKSRFAKRYPKEFQRQLVDLYRAGNTLTNLSQRFGPTPWAISRWVKQADRRGSRATMLGRLVATPTAFCRQIVTDRTIAAGAVAFYGGGASADVGQPPRDARRAAAGVPGCEA